MKIKISLFLTLAFLTSCSLFSGNRSLDEKSNDVLVLNSELETAVIAADISEAKAAVEAKAQQAAARSQIQKTVVATTLTTVAAPASVDNSAPQALAVETEELQSEKVSEKAAVSNSVLTKKRSPSSAGPEMYTVKNGDTLMKISYEKFGNIYRWREIYNQNRDKIPDYNHLVTGTILKIRGVEYVVLMKNGTPYLIRRSDTLAKISKSLYGTTAGWKSLWLNNRQLIHDPNKIYAGFTLYYQKDYRTQQQPIELKLSGKTKTPPDRLPAKTD